MTAPAGKSGADASGAAALSPSDRAAAEKVYRQEVQDFLESAGDAYEITRVVCGPLATTEISERVAEHFKKTGKALTMKQAADALEAQLEADAKRFAQSKKLSGRVQPQPTGNPEAERTARTLAVIDAALSKQRSANPPGSSAEAQRRARTIEAVGAALKRFNK